MSPSTAVPTLGVEEEYQLCDPDTGDLVPAVDTLLAAAPEELRGQLGYELLHTVLEADTPIAVDVDEAAAQVRRLRCAIMDLAQRHGVAIGVVTILVRLINPAYPEGTMLAILLMNAFAPGIDHFVVAANIKRRMKRA